MPIVQNFPTDPNRPDVFVREAAPTAAIRGTGTGVVGVLVQAIRGPVNTPTLIGDLSQFIRTFGSWDTTINSGFNFVRNLFTNGATAVSVVRVTDGTELSASGAVSGTTFQLTTPGTWGNTVTLTITASAITGYVDLTFQYGTQEIYSYTQVTFTSTSDARYYKTIIENSADAFVNIAVVGSTNPSPQVITFTGGSNGSTSGAGLADTAYVGTEDATKGKTGLVAFEADDTDNFICADRTTTVVNSGLMTHVALSTVSPRMAIISQPQGTTVSATVTAMATINSDQVIMTYPWVQILNPYNNKKEYHAPTSFYAGVLSKLSYEQSPSRKQITGIVGTERALSNSDLDTLGKNRVSPIALMNGQGFLIRNGYNTSSDPARRNIPRRRAVNYFTKVFEVGSQQFVSLPHTKALRDGVKSAFSGLIETELRAGRIGNANNPGNSYIVKCDEQNNPDIIQRQNKLMVDIQISLLAPADYIFVTLDASEAKTISIQ